MLVKGIVPIKHVIDILCNAVVVVQKTNFEPISMAPGEQVFAIILCIMMMKRIRCICLKDFCILETVREVHRGHHMFEDGTVNQDTFLRIQANNKIIYPSNLDCMKYQICIIYSFYEPTILANLLIW